MEDLILIARVLGAHGIKGELKIAAYTADPLALKTYKTLLNKNGEVVLTVRSARLASNAVIAVCRELADRDAAEAMKGTELYIPRAALAEPEEDEFYLTDLIGLEARSPEGEVLGKVAAVENYGAGDLLDIRPLAAPSWLVEFTRANVPMIDVELGYLVIARPHDAE